MNWKDFTERVFWTFVQAFAGVLLIANQIDATTAQAATAAGAAAALAVVKVFAQQSIAASKS